MVAKERYSLKPNAVNNLYTVYLNEAPFADESGVAISGETLNEIFTKINNHTSLSSSAKALLCEDVEKQYKHLEKARENQAKKNEEAKVSEKAFLNQTLTTDLDNFVINDMSTNVSFYDNVGMKISNLVYPTDLLNTSTDNPAYNGCYTIFFISEHSDSTIVTKESASKYRYDGRNGFIAEDTKKYGASEKATKLVGSGLVTYAAYKASSTLLGPLLADETAANLGGAAIGIGVGGTILSAGIVGSNKTQFTQLKSCIALPTPALQQQNNIEWAEEGNAIVNNIVSALHKGSSYISDMDMSGAGFKKAVKDLAEGSQEFGSMVALSASSMGVDILQKMAGKTANSRKEQLFKDVSFRKYRFSYDLYARDEAEMQSIQSIIQVLKYHAHPELSNSDFLYIYPAQFDIVHYFNGKPNPYMPKHATSVLTGIDIQYGTNDIPSINNDGSPTLIKMDLEFTELALLNKKDIAEGY